MFSRPGQSQGLLYKHLCPLINKVRDPLVPTALGRRHAQPVRVSSSSYKIDLSFLNPEGHQNPINVSKVTSI